MYVHVIFPVPARVSAPMKNRRPALKECMKPWGIRSAATCRRGVLHVQLI